MVCVWVLLFRSPLVQSSKVFVSIAADEGLQRDARAVAVRAEKAKPL
jgi:hypothetical protein